MRPVDRPGRRAYLPGVRVESQAMTGVSRRAQQRAGHHRSCAAVPGDASQRHRPPRPGAVAGRRGLAKTLTGQRWRQARRWRSHRDARHGTAWVGHPDRRCARLHGLPWTGGKTGGTVEVTGSIPVSPTRICAGPRFKAQSLTARSGASSPDC
jgi:hypothetical protein